MPGARSSTSDETVENPYRYARYRADDSTGLYYCWNRYYAPELGRFLTRDIYPGDTSDPVTMNPYLYCGGDPVNAVDPSGMMSANSVLAGALGLGAIVLGLVCIGLTVGSFGILAPETAAGLAVAAGALGTALGMISRVVTQQQYIDGELSPAEYRVQMMIAGAGTAASAGGAVYAACGGAASVMAAWLAVEGFNWSVTGGGLWLGQFLRDITRN
ncbi:MAG: RHS repeat-associated core domain-containing protein [Actinomycetia bacterium]|nr:RHS repeat-associated core domain-containing protein [Actinomycetes bacterium]